MAHRRAGRLDLRGDPIDGALTRFTVPRRAALGIATAAAIVGISWEQLDPIWSKTAVAALVIVLAWAVPTAQVSLPPAGLPLVLLGVSAVIYACVPETDPIRVLVLLPAVAVVIEFVRREPLPLTWVWCVAAFVAWAGVHGATGRGSALVGAIAAWWPVVLTSLVHTARFSPRSGVGRLALLAPAGAASAIVARTGAIEPTVEPAWRAVAVWLPASLVVTFLLAAASRRVSGRGGRPGATRPSTST